MTITVENRVPGAEDFTPPRKGDARTAMDLTASKPIADRKQYAADIEAVLQGKQARAVTEVAKLTR